jgi:general secretion pathway protein A
MAFVELFRLWGMNYQNGAEPCTQAEAQGLICLTTKGGLDELHQFNLPAMLHLQDDQGHKFYATLTKLDATSATLIVDNKKYNINHDFIAQHWSGVYSLLFRQPRDVHENMQLGESGPSVEWLSKQLAQVQGRKVDPAKAAVFDLSLKRQVKRFQFSQGLTPDGVAGPRTLARLSALADQSAPRLSSMQGRK